MKHAAIKSRKHTIEKHGVAKRGIARRGVAPHGVAQRGKAAAAAREAHRTVKFPTTLVSRAPPETPLPRQGKA